MLLSHRRVQGPHCLRSSSRPWFGSPPLDNQVGNCEAADEHIDGSINKSQWELRAIPAMIWARFHMKNTLSIKKLSIQNVTTGIITQCELEKCAPSLRAMIDNTSQLNICATPIR